MVLDDNNSQIGIEGFEPACRKPMYIGHDENRTVNQIYLLDSNWKWRLLMARFRPLGSRQNRSAPLLSVTQTRELTQSVGSVTFARIPCVTRESSSFLKGSLRVSWTGRGGCTTGGTAASTVIWNSPSKNNRRLQSNYHAVRGSPSWPLGLDCKWAAEQHLVWTLSCG